MLAVAVIALVIQAGVAITILIKFMWKVATKDDIKSLKDDVKSLKADTECDIKSLKTDTEHDVESLKTEIKDGMREFRQDLNGAGQDHMNHLRDHSNSSSSKNETRREDPGPPSIEDFKTPRKGKSTADERDKRT